jgi:demethylmenaquinone methyltransferase/2-methoxy-6-polyprenyl-1,4-benzoquinol methylase
MKPYNQEQTKKEQVEEMFDNIAPSYDRLNHIISFNLDRIWRRRVVRIVERAKAARVMDIATGTGDLVIAMAKHLPSTQILGVDLSEAILGVARVKVSKRGMSDRIELVKGDAENIAMVSDGAMDAVTVAFGVRNFDNLERGLKEIHRTLHEGGTFVVLELSVPKNRLIRWFYAQYSHRILPGIGAMISKDKKAYVYLPESIDEFPAPERFEEILKGVGFKSVKRHKQSFGVAHIYEAVK